MTTTINNAVKILHDAVIEGVPSARMAERLDAAGLLAKDLPAPSLYADGDPDGPMWDTVNHFRTDALDAPKVALSKAGELWKMTPANARALAYALLAAANHAERGVTGGIATTHQGQP